MPEDRLNKILSELPPCVNLVAVSKFHPAEAIMELYRAGHLLFGESRPQELKAKAEALPKDIRWHFIGHLQTNKLKMVLPYVDMVESVDSLHLLEAIDKWGIENKQRVNILLEVHIASEESKQGFLEEELPGILAENYEGLSICGLMGMATNTSDESIIRSDFEKIRNIKRRLETHHPEIRELSIGMSSDWKIALEYDATIVRIGTAIFGERDYSSK
ncbi:MAG: YggS family pyridoxal phosphate-dependent enzyme [Bacteroidales bacterium]|nr:YggS family pyridoxal phosphate-dependent enzyme [Bacteroidales bacterium]